MMKKNILLFIILSLTMGLFAQRVQQQNTKIKPQKQAKVDYEAKYYQVLAENEELQLENGRKNTKINKALSELKVKQNEVDRLKKGYAKINLEKNDMHAEIKTLREQVAKLKAAGDMQKYKAEIAKLKRENKKMMDGSAKLRAENQQLQNKINKLEAELNSHNKKKGKVIKVQQQ
jgi:chromosome segregation ATPase